MLNTLILLAGGFILVLLQALNPNYWIPIAAVGRTEEWKRKEFFLYTSLISTAHFLSTFIIGFIMGIVAYRLALFYPFIARVVAPSIVLIVGIVYLLINFLQKEKEYDTVKEPAKPSRMALVFSIAIAGFFSPALEISFYYSLAGSHGILNIILLSIIFAALLITLTTFLVVKNSTGEDKLRWILLENHEKLFKGSVLIIMGIIGFFLKI